MGLFDTCGFNMSIQVVRKTYKEKLHYKVLRIQNPVDHQIAFVKPSDEVDTNESKM